MIKWTQVQRQCKKLPLIDQFFMFCHKIRLGSLDQDLADKFRVSQATLSRNTISWANFLYCLLGSQPLWPTKTQVQKYMPKSFKDSYPNVQCSGTIKSGIKFRIILSL